MRVKANFSVFPRKLTSGRVVYYYQCYDKKEKRQWAKSTGKTKKTEAVLFCMELFKDGLLIPEPKVPTFAEFSKGWWEIETCNYLKWRIHDNSGELKWFPYEHYNIKHVAVVPYSPNMNA